MNALARRSPGTGVLVVGVTATAPVVALLRAGADDVVGVCGAAELAARIRAVERRTAPARSPEMGLADVDPAQGDPTAGSWPVSSGRIGAVAITEHEGSRGDPDANGR